MLVFCCSALFGCDIKEDVDIGEDCTLSAPYADSDGDG
jgi:hypothetical protein